MSEIKPAYMQCPQKDCKFRILLEDDESKLESAEKVFVAHQTQSGHMPEVNFDMIKWAYLEKNRRLGEDKKPLDESA